MKRIALTSGVICAVLASIGASAATISVSQPLPGQLLLSEIMGNPAGDDQFQEWFEVYNPLPVAVDLGGMTVASNNGQFSVGSGLVVGSLGYAIFARSSDPALNGNLPSVGMAWGQAMTLRNEGGQLALHRPDGALIVSASWETMASGVSRELVSGTAPLFVHGDYIDGTAPYDSQTYAQPLTPPPNTGTPGAANDAPLDVTGTTKLVISEFLANPAGATGDTAREWFEILNLDSTPVNLNGVTVKVGAQSFTITGDHFIPSGGYFVIASSDDPAINGGLPRVDYAWGDALILPNSNGELSLLDPDGTTIVSASWTSVTEGRAKQLRNGAGPAFADANYDDSSTPYSAPAPIPGDPLLANLGTPGGPGPSIDVAGIPPYEEQAAVNEPPVIAIFGLAAGLALALRRRMRLTTHEQ